MRITKVELSKELTLSLPNYQNVKPGIRLSVEIGENEKIDWGALWDEINQQLWLETDIDPQWIKAGETKTHWKYILKVKKRSVK